jgi:hypothetical protein
VAEVGLSARTHNKGGTARTLAGSVRYDDVNYTAIGEVAYRLRDCSAYTRCLTTAFLSPAAESALQPSPKHIAGRVHDRNPLDSTWCVSMAMTPSSVVRELQELIAALDRRVPQVQRAGEASIARDAAALKARALKRIEELEREQPRGS